MVTSARPALAQVTAQYDNARTGANAGETRLKPTNVDPQHFGKRFSLTVEGDVYAQPLYLAGVVVPGKGTHAVVFIATEHDDVYAFDAGGAPSGPLWHTRLADSARGATPVPSVNVGCPFIRPDVGISSTPVIDPVSGTIYVLARTSVPGNGGEPQFVQRLHALDIRTGIEKPGGPITIIASVPGRGDGSAGGRVSFNPLRENPRSALLLSKGLVYLGWASSCDFGAYHGWIMAYDGRTLRQVAVFNTTPDGTQGGVWQGHAGLAADAGGNVYAATGNGTFDADKPGGRDYGMSVLKLKVVYSQFLVSDYFTPYNQGELSAQDQDLGSGGPVLLPDGAPLKSLVVGGKDGTLYLINRDQMGHFHAGADDHAIQTFKTGDGTFGAPAVWNGRLYLLGSNDVLRAFEMTGQPRLKPASVGKVRFIDPGASPTVSAAGTHDGIVWVIDSKGWRSPDRPAVLHAFDAVDVSHELYNSEQNSARDRAGSALRFTIPTVANGRVYIGAKNEVDVYGPLDDRH